MCKQEIFRSHVMSEMLSNINYVSTVENYSAFEFLNIVITIKNTTIKFILRYKVIRKNSLVGHVSDVYERDYITFYYQFITYYMNNYGVTGKEVDLMWEEISKRLDGFVYKFLKGTFFSNVSFSYPEFPNVETITEILKDNRRIRV